MVELSDIINVQSIACNVEVSSKKKALHKLSSMLCDAVNSSPVENREESGKADSAESDEDEEQLNEMDVLDALVGRERLGSTALGQGIALPHGRIEQLERSVAVLITLAEGIEFDAPDDEPVDIIFALLVPEDSTDEHLKILGNMAEKFSDENITRALRECNGEDCQHAYASLCADSNIASNAGETDKANEKNADANQSGNDSAKG